MQDDAARVRAFAIDVFQDESIADDWLNTFNKALAARPKEILKTKGGAERVERLLTRIKHGVYS